MRLLLFSLLPLLASAFTVVSFSGCEADEPAKPFGLTTEGLVEGKAAKGLRIYRGVPFAAPPTEAAAGRFRDTTRPRSRTQPLATSSPAPGCPQPNELYSNAAPPYALSEECLTLDIWTPAETAKDALPVLLWIHGGGLARGSAARPGFNPSEFARRGIVVVGIQYRLGALGFLAHPALEAEGPSGMYGVRDQLRALRWVHANATAFGGDPARITVAGHSAGAASLLPLMASSEAQPLFVAAILHSPVVDPLSLGGRADEYSDRSTAFAAGEAVAASLGASTADELRALDVSNWANARFSARFSLDAQNFTSSFRDTVATGALGHRRLLLGHTEDESAIFLPPNVIPRSEADLQMRAARESQGGVMPGPNTGTLAQRYAEFIEREGFERPIRRIANAATSAGWSVYVYRYSGLHGGARHGTDVPLLFGAEPAVQKGTAASVLRKATQEYWASFVTDGEPRTTAGGAVDWPTYDVKSGRYLVLSGKIHSAKR